MRPALTNWRPSTPRSSSTPGMARIGRFRNFMAFDRSWLEEEGSEDSFGRTLWSLGATASTARGHDLRRWALHLFDQVAPHARSLGSPRTWAFSMLAADAVLDAHPGHELARALLANGATRLLGLLATHRRAEWDWFEPSLAYDNARLPEALMRAGRRLDDPSMRTEGLATLAWLDRHSDERGRAVPRGGHRQLRPCLRPPLPFDQQPLEAWATIDAARVAASLSADGHWVATAQRAYAWYQGANDLGLPLGSSSDGGCFDGLMSDRVNLNQGAESVLAFQFACCAMREMTEKAEVNGSTIKAGRIAFLSRRTSSGAGGRFARSRHALAPAPSGGSVSGRRSTFPHSDRRQARPDQPSSAYRGLRAGDGRADRRARTHQRAQGFRGAPLADARGILDALCPDLHRPEAGRCRDPRASSAN